MEFRLFQIVTVLLLVRPGDLIPGLSGLPFYDVAILLALAAALVPLVERLTLTSLVESPVTLCVVGLLPAVVLSHLAHLNLGSATGAAQEFGKILIYYLLLVSVVDRAERLNRFLSTVIGCTVVLTSLALLQYYGIIDLPALQSIDDEEVDSASGHLFFLLRLCSVGIFHDPNDLSMVLVASLVLTLHRFTDRSRGGRRLVWIAPLVLFTHALTKTHSRGGFIALLAALVVLALGRFGWRRAVPVLVAVLPAAFVLFAGRQTNLSATTDTGQDRIRIWSEGLMLFRESPLFGVGQNRYVEEVGIVAHNSFVHGFAELGLFGGTLFLGAFYAAFAALARLGRWETLIADPGIRRLRPYMLAIVTSYGVGLLTLSRIYTPTTYLILGLASAYLRVAVQRSPLRVQPAGFGLACRLGTVGVVFVAATYAFVRLLARFNG